MPRNVLVQVKRQILRPKFRRYCTSESLERDWGRPDTP